MPVKWISLAEQDRRHQADGVTMQLRVFSSVEVEVLCGTIPVPPERCEDYLPGIGDYDCWCALLGEVPCTIVISADRREARGAVVHLPLLLTLDGRLDLSILSLLQLLPEALYRGFHGMDLVPFAGPGYEVYPEYWGYRVPVTTRLREDAQQLVEVLDGLTGRRHGILPAEGAVLRRTLSISDGAPRWLLAGPRVGPFVSLLMDCDSREEAEAYARKRSAARKGPWMIFHGDLGPRAVAVFRGGEEAPSEPWALYRQDDNGHRFLVAILPAKEDAEAAADVFEARGHKQLYTCEPAPGNNLGSPGR